MRDVLLMGPLIDRAQFDTEYIGNLLGSEELVHNSVSHETKPAYCLTRISLSLANVVRSRTIDRSNLVSSAPILASGTRTEY